MKTNMNKKLKVRSEKLETNESAALPYSSNSYLLTPNFPIGRSHRYRDFRIHASTWLLRPLPVPCNLSPVTSLSRPRRAAPVPCNLSPVTSLPRQRRAAGFTLIEMLVALSILIILMAAVGEIFSLAARTVRFGQATLTAMSSIRAVESQIAHDVKHLDTNGFLVSASAITPHTGKSACSTSQAMKCSI